MGRPAAISNDEILAAARVVFLAKGISATVGDVAARCHVGEATIFRRYPTKHALFLASLDTGQSFEWARWIEDSSEADGRTLLRRVAGEMLAMGRRIAPLVMLKMSNPNVGERRGPPASMFRAFDALTKFFEQQIGMGRVRAQHARAATRIFFGSIHSFVMLEAFSPRDAGGMTDAEFLDDIVDVLFVPCKASATLVAKRKKKTK